MFSLHVEATPWREHADSVRNDIPGLVPVAKGNGYGFGLSTLAAESDRLACDTVAVGQFDELAAVHDAFRARAATELVALEEPDFLLHVLGGPS